MLRSPWMRLRRALGGLLVRLGARLLPAPRVPPGEPKGEPAAHGLIRPWPEEEITRWLTPPEPDRPRNGGGRVEIPDVW